MTTGGYFNSAKIRMRFFVLYGLARIHTKLHLSNLQIFFIITLIPPLVSYYKSGSQGTVPTTCISSQEISPQRIPTFRRGDINLSWKPMPWLPPQTLWTMSLARTAASTLTTLRRWRQNPRTRRT